MQLTIEETKLEKLIEQIVHKTVQQAVHEAFDDEFRTLLHELAESRIPFVSKEEQAEIEKEFGEDPGEEDIVRSFTLRR